MVNSWTKTFLVFAIAYIAWQCLRVSYWVPFGLLIVLEIYVITNYEHDEN